MFSHQCDVFFLTNLALNPLNGDGGVCGLGEISPVVHVSQHGASGQHVHTTPQDIGCDHIGTIFAMKLLSCGTVWCKIRG